MTPSRFAGLTSWHADWRGLRVAVLGLGSSGFAAADTLLELGAEVLVAATESSGQQQSLLAVMGGRYLESPDFVPVPQEFVQFQPELVIVSPGFAPDHPLLMWAVAAGIPVWGDVELAWRVRDKISPAAEWIVLTATTELRTTTALTAHLIETAGHRVAAVGSTGTPVLDAVRYPLGFDVIVVGVSPAQLRWTSTESPGALVPWASLCLSADSSGLNDPALSLAVGKIYSNTRMAAIYNRSDDRTLRMVEEADVTEGCRAVSFGLDAPGPSDLGIVDGILCDRAFLEERKTTALELSTREELDALGMGDPHSVTQVLAASALARSWDVSPAQVREGLRTFVPEHGR